MKKKRKLLLIIAIFFIILATGYIFKSKLLSLITGNPIITPIETTKLKFITYNDSQISLSIPNTWVVETSNSYANYSVKIYDKENSLYQVFINLEIDGFNKTQAEKNLWKKYYGESNQYAKMPILSPQSTEEFYKTYKDLSIINKNNFYPVLNNFTKVEDLENNIIRATFTTKESTTGEGLFTATLKSSGSYYVYGIDTSPINAYNVVGLTTPEGEFVTWKDTLIIILKSIKFSDKFLANFNQNNDTILSNMITEFPNISKNLNDAWAKHDSSYDAINGKRIDKTLKYERIVDTETNKTYRAYTGWIKTYHGKTYTLVKNNELYSKPLSGYIKK